MGNHHSGSYSGLKPRKNVHWKSAERPSAPGKPDINPIISDEEQNAIILKWEPPRTDGGAPLVGYQVECNRLGTSIWIHTSPPVITKAELILTGLEPGYKYQFRVSAENAVGVSGPSEISDILNVSLDKAPITAPMFTEGLKDTTALENEKVEFKVTFEGIPQPTISWFMDGYEIFSSRRTAITTERNSSVLIFHQTSLNDEGEIKCTATNRAGHVNTRAKFQLESIPKIRLPRQYGDGLLYEINETIFFKVSVVGKPTPTMEWRHDGQLLKSDDRIDISNTEKFSVLRISNATRNDRGEYHIFARNNIGEDVASFLVTITAKPDQPGPIKTTLLEGNSVMLSWLPPKDDGGCKIGNYIIEYFRTGWDVWLKATYSRKLTTVINDLIEGSEYRFRVKAESPYGLSIPSEESFPIFVPGKSTNNTPILGSEVGSFEKNKSPSKAKPNAVSRKKILLRSNLEDDDFIGEKILSSSIVIDSKQLENISPRKDQVFNMKSTPKLDPGSSEFLLVLYPENEKNSTDKRKSFQLDLEDALTPPPLSLSAPELGTTHFLPMRPLRNSVSSTELLHEHAMNRFYQAMALKEAQKCKVKRETILATTPEMPQIKIDIMSDDENNFKNVTESLNNINHCEAAETKFAGKSQKNANYWKSASYDEDYSASTVSSVGSERSDSLRDEVARDNITFSDEESTYHPTAKVLGNTEDNSDTSKSKPSSDSNFIPKPILKRRQLEAQVNKEESNKKIKNKSPKISEKKTEKVSLFRKITKPQFPKSFTLRKKNTREHENSKPADEGVTNNNNTDVSSKFSKQIELFVPSDDIDEGRIVIEHYGNIVKEFGQTKKTQPLLYTDTDQLKKAAALQDNQIPTKPKVQHVKKKIHHQASNNQKTLSPGVSTKNETNKNMKKINLSNDSDKLKPSAIKTPKTDNLLRATIIIPKDYSALESEAKVTVHSAIDYTIDIVMLLVAFWLFLFKDERLAVPILMITIYRQLHEALSQKLPPWFFQKLRMNKQ